MPYNGDILIYLLFLSALYSHHGSHLSVLVTTYFQSIPEEPSYPRKRKNGKKWKMKKRKKDLFSVLFHTNFQEQTTYMLISRSEDVWSVVVMVAVQLSLVSGRIKFCLLHSSNGVRNTVTNHSCQETLYSA